MCRTIPLVSEEHITAFGWASPQEIDDMMALAIRVNDFLSGLFLGIGVQLVDFKIELGRLVELAPRDGLGRRASADRRARRQRQLAAAP